MVMGAHRVQRKSRRAVHMTSKGDLEVNAVVLPAEPRRYGGALLLSALSGGDSIQACCSVLYFAVSKLEEAPENHISISTLPPSPQITGRSNSRVHIQCSGS
jgi:hypothetical protein